MAPDRRQPAPRWTQVACLLALLAGILGAEAAGAAAAPPGLVSWGSETVTLAAGESVNLRVDFARMPVRRWTLLVESNGVRSHLNVRRVHDGSLLYDEHGETEHAVDVPWGEGEVLSAVLTSAADGGVFTITYLGPPPDQHVRAYSYEVNRALEAYAEGHRTAAAAYCRDALRQDPHDGVAALLLRSLSRAGYAEAPVDTIGQASRRRRVIAAQRQAQALRQQGRPYEALDMLVGALAEAPDSETAALVAFDLGELYRTLDNPIQARDAYTAARTFGLPPELERRAAAALAALPDSTGGADASPR